MRRIIKVSLHLLGAVAFLIGALFGVANVDPGRRMIETLVASLTGGTVRIDGLAGRFPDALHLARLRVADGSGVYLTINDISLDWSPSRLLTGLAQIDAVIVARVNLARLPESEPSSGTGGGVPPIRIAVQRLHVERLELEPPVAGHQVSVTVDGSARLLSLREGQVSLIVAAAADRYVGDLRLTPDRLHATVTLTEAPQGLVARLATLPDIGAIDARVEVDGPLNRLAANFTLAAGPLRATASGVIDVTTERADLTVSATAPAMTPRPDVSWRSVDLAGQVHGSFVAPSATGTLTIDHLSAAGARIDSVRATLSGESGEASVAATLNGIRLPGPSPDLLSATPLVFDGTVKLNQPGRPATFTLQHSRGRADGTASLEAPSAKIHLVVPELAPFASAAGVDIQGKTVLDLEVLTDADVTTATLRGVLGITAGMDPLPRLMGPSGQIDITATIHGSDVTLRQARVNGPTGGISASGDLTGGRLGFDWSAHLSDLSAVQPTLSGSVEASGRIEGPLDRFTVTADLTGDVAAQGYRSGRVAVHLAAQTLPASPQFRLTAEGTLLDAPVSLSVTGEQRDNATEIRINRSTWKSLSADGSLTVTAGTAIPTGQVQIQMPRLEDLAPLLGRPIGGAVVVDLTSDATSARARITLEGATVPGVASVHAATLAVVVTDPVGSPSVDGTLDAQGIRSGGIFGSARLTAKGPIESLVIALTTDLADVAGSPVQASAAATLHGSTRTLDLTALRANWRQQSLALVVPARIRFATDLAVDRLRLSLGRAELTAAGRIGETIDLTASLRNLPAELVALFAPDLAADGVLTADLRLSGSTARPNGTLRARATGLRLRQGAGATLPPGSVTLDVTMEGGVARTDARAVVGPSSFSLTGTVPLRLNEGVDLRARGAIDLAMTDPILTPSGRRARGRLEFDVGVGGPLAAPRTNGTIRLANADIQDVTLGARMHGINATIQADGDNLRLTHFDARAGTGTIQANGSLGLSGDMLVRLNLRASNARPLASDLMTVLLDADLNLTGAVATDIAIGGTVRVRRADIRVPERLPSSIATIPTRIAGSPAPPPPQPRAAPAIALNVTLDAPDQIFVRGRGLNAELGGRITFGGTLANPQPNGAFGLRRGTYEIIGQTIKLTEGRIDFTGAGLADPTLRMVATSQRGGVAASAIVSGRVKDPKVTLSSVPELPQDEILSQLLFNTATAKLSPFQIAQLANGLASLAGTPFLGTDPLDRVRAAVGLDRLTVGSDASGRPMLEAGRYLADGVYVGTKQGTSGADTQATVQIDIGKGLKLEATTGTGQGSATGGVDPANSTSVGITYQFEY